MTVAAIPMNYVMSAGIDVAKQGIFLEPKNEPLAVMVLAAREKDKDNPTYKKLLRFTTPRRLSSSLPINLKAPLNRLNN